MENITGICGIKMNKIKVFPTSIYEFNADPALVQKSLEKVKTLEYQSNSANQRSKTDLFYDKELFTWFNSCILEAKKDIGIPDFTDLVITSCWVNKTVKLQQHHKHWHNNSFLSGVFYLTSHEADGNINFFDRNSWIKNFNWLKIKGSLNEFNFEMKETYYPAEGKLILFPSYLEHEVKTLKNHNIRYSIAFNSFFSSIIDDTDVHSCRLELKTKSVADHYET